MIPSDGKYIFYLEDILLSMERIDEYINGSTFISFKKNYM